MFYFCKMKTSLLFNPILCGIVGLLAFTMFACQTTETPPAPQKEKEIWKEHPEVRYDQKILNTARVVGNKLYMAGAYHLLTFNENHQLERSVRLHEAGHVNSKPTLGNNVVAFGDNNKNSVTLYSLANPEVKLTIDISQHAPAGYRNESISYFNSSMAINENNQLLVKLFKDFQDRNLVYLIYSFEVTAQHITVQTPKLIQMPAPENDYTQSTNNCALGETFYSSVQRQGTYKISATGEIEKLADVRFAYPVQLKDTLALVGHNFNWNVQYQILPTNQSTWQGYETNFQEDGFMRFWGINHQCLGTYNVQMIHFQMDFKRGKYTLKEIDNEGLAPLMQVENILVFKDLVYITTLNGVFTKPLKDFFTYKP